MSIIDSLGQAPVGALKEHVIRAFTRKLERVFGAARIPFAITGIDISVNEDHQNPQKSWFQVHAWSILPLNRQGGQEQILRKAFPSSDTIQRPIHIKLYDGKRRAIAYGLREHFTRRVSITAKGSTETGRKPHRNTRNRLLRTSQLIELLLVLDQLRIDGRLHLFGVRKVKGKQGPVLKFLQRSVSGKSTEKPKTDVKPHVRAHKTAP